MYKEKLGKTESQGKKEIKRAVSTKKQIRTVNREDIAMNRGTEAMLCEAMEILDRECAKVSRRRVGKE